MAKIRTLAILQEALDRELSWRIHELSFLKRQIMAAKDIAESAYIRAGISMLYAHWEGFIKTSASLYLEYVNFKRAKFSVAADTFAYLAVKRDIDELSKTKDHVFGLRIYRDIIRKVISDEPLFFSTDVDTGSNLNSKRFLSILSATGISESKYEPYFNLIDEALLARRNEIAHGQFLPVERDSFLKTYDDVIMLMRWFKTDVENCASTDSYLQKEA
ncbi:hypothetical protein KBY23_09850 [Ruegeria pomeroyi]|nr:hypothetical protein [Ruegeria pomeroyi]